MMSSFGQFVQTSLAFGLAHAWVLLSVAGAVLHRWDGGPGGRPTAGLALTNQLQIYTSKEPTEGKI